MSTHPLPRARFQEHTLKEHALKEHHRRRRQRSSRLVRAAVAGLLALVLAACGAEPAGTGGEQTQSSDAELSVWTISDALGNTEVTAAVQFNISSDVWASVKGFANDPYKAELQAAMDTATPPDVFLNWGGGHLKQFVDAGKVMDLTAALESDPAFLDQFLPSVLDAVQLDGKTYGVPVRGVQPVLLFYNRSVFQEAGLQPPATWNDLLALVDAFQAQGIQPIALAGAQSWTELMWIEYLLDRVGGVEKFQAIAGGAEGAWRDPAVLTALEMTRELVDRGAFGSSFETVGYDVGGASTLLAEGEAAMHLMGSWEFATQLDQNPEFAADQLGWVPFPTVANGAGDPANLVGNPANYMSVSAEADAVDGAVEFINRAPVSDSYINSRIALGEVPPLEGIEIRLTENPHSDYLTFVYDLVRQAPNFTQSWDQALSPTVSKALLASLPQFFLEEITAEQFVAAMETATAEAAAQ